jgi:hypothetical protein
MRSFIVSLFAIVRVTSVAFAQTAPPPAAPEPVAATTPPSVTAAPAAPPAAPVVSTTPAPSVRGASVWGVLPWGGIGAGGRFMLPLRIPSLLKSPRVRDNFSLEFGADILRWTYGADTFYSSSYSWTEILPVVGLSWNFWFSDSFALYPKVEAGYAIGWVSNSAYGAAGYGGTFASGAGGLLYRLGGGLTLRAEAGSSGLKAGAGWLF